MNPQATFPNAAELVSASVDGEASSDDLDVVLAACNGAPDSLASWGIYHLIGDALRASAVASRSSSTLRQGIASRLESEFLQSDVGQSDRKSFAAAEIVLRSETVPPQAAANDSVFRWKMIAGVASVLAVSALAWTALGTTASVSGSQLATGPTADQVLVETARGLVVRDAGLEAMLAAHKQLGATVVEMPSGFLRNATFDTQPTSLGR